MTTLAAGRTSIGAIVMLLLTASAAHTATPAAHAATPAANAATIDSEFFGAWRLAAAKSMFGSTPAAAGLVNWSAEGWAFAVVGADGSLYSDAVDTRDGCRLIGVPDSFTCELVTVSPRHLRMTIRDGSIERRVTDIELLDHDTTKTTHHVAPDKGAPYTEVTVWTRAAN